MVKDDYDVVVSLLTLTLIVDFDQVWLRGILSILSGVVGILLNDISWLINFMQKIGVLWL